MPRSLDDSAARRFCACLALSGLLSSTAVSCVADPGDSPGMMPATPDQQPAQLPADQLPAEQQEAPAESWALEVIAEYPHDPTAYTQGLVFVDDELWESTGNYGTSSIRRTDFESGEVLQQAALPPDFFGEGLAFVDGGFWQLTWYAGTALRWDRSLQLIETVAYQGQGWGLCYDGKHLWRSDGSGMLYRHDPDTFAAVDRVQFHDLYGPVHLINELECVDGLIYANVYTLDELLVLDPERGRVMARIDATELRRRLGEEATGAGALNGIAYHPQREIFFVTGKYWPKTFEVRFNPTTEPTENTDDRQ